MKTKEELKALKKKVETGNSKPYELTDEELTQASGGGFIDTPKQNDEVNPETDYCAYFEPKRGKSEKLCKNCKHSDIIVGIANAGEIITGARKIIPGYVCFIAKTGIWRRIPLDYVDAWL